MKTVHLDFGEFLMNDDYVIGIINEGIVFNKRQYNELLRTCKSHYEDRPFGYISNRIHSYTIDPMMYKNVSNLADFFAIAIVSNDSISVERSYRIEQFFYSGHFHHYDNLNDAHKWISAVMEVRKIRDEI